MRNEYSVESDIWASAVVIWEILSHGNGNHKKFIKFAVVVVCVEHGMTLSLGLYIHPFMYVMLKLC